MCSPLTDSRWVRPLAAHRLGVLFGDRILVAGGERGGDPGRAGSEGCSADMPRAGGCAARSSPRGSAGSRTSTGPIALPTAPMPLEPGVAGEIVAAGQRHRRRRREPGPEPDQRPARQPVRRVLVVDRHPNPRRQRRIGGAQRQPERRLWRRDVRPARPGPSNLGRPAAARAAARRPTPTRAQTRAQPSVAASANQPSARPARPLPRREAGQRQRGRDAQERRPVASAGRARTRRRCRAEADREPRRQLRALAPRGAFEPLASRAETRPPKAPSTLWKRRIRYVRGARPLHCSMKRRGKRA